VRALDRWRERPREVALPALLMLLTVTSGLIDGVSYVGLGHVFVANMTGNIVFLGFAIAGVPGLSITASLVALGAFLVGAAVGGRATRRTQHPGRLLTAVTTTMVVLVSVAAALSAVAHGSAERYALIVVLALALGLQNATARGLGVADLTTTVLTLTLTGIAADSSLAGGTNPRLTRRSLAVVAMFLGALVGALLVLHVNVTTPLWIATVLFALTAVAAHVLSRDTPPETWVRD
jgi:uncharacterized membrane protein YoaK (UPF0700 family)